MKSSRVRKCHNIAESGERLRVRRCNRGAVVFANCSQKENQRLRNVSKSLIVNVDQTGLEPVTSRL